MKDIKFKDKIAQGINDLFYIWKREFQTTFRDQGVLIFFILVPLGYPCYIALSMITKWCAKSRLSL